MRSVVLKQFTSVIDRQTDIVATAYCVLACSVLSGENDDCHNYHNYNEN